MGQRFDDDGVVESFQEILGDLFGRGPSTSGDVHLLVKIPLLEAAHGGKRRVEVPITSRCSTCAGTGAASGARSLECRTCSGKGKLRSTERHAAVEVSCRACGGRGETWSAACAPCEGVGRVVTRSDVDVTIPPGVADGATLRLGGRGNEIAGKRGDVLLTIEVAPHPRLRREGDDLHVRMPFDPARAAEGDTLSVPWLEGHARVPMPAGAKAGDVLRLPGWGAVKMGSVLTPPPATGGMPYRSSAPGRGDLLVTLVGAEALASAYETLGLRPGARRSEIDRAYRRLMQVYTPVTDETEVRVARIEGAYAELALVEEGPPTPMRSDARSVAIVGSVLAAISMLAYLLLR